MEIVANVIEPEILCEQQIGSPFLCHHSEIGCMVMMRVVLDPVDAIHIDMDGVEEVPDPEAEHHVVVLGCRGSRPGDPGHVPVGVVLRLAGATPVTRLEQLAPLSLRAAEERLRVNPPTDPT